jgi:hypothetical protein
MNSFNELNGIPATGKYLQREILEIGILMVLLCQTGVLSMR